MRVLWYNLLASSRLRKTEKINYPWETHDYFSTEVDGHTNYFMIANDGEVIKYIKGNKTNLMYKEPKFYYPKEINIKPNSSVTPNIRWIGYYDGTLKTFFTNPSYEGNIDVFWIIDKLRGLC